MKFPGLDFSKINIYNLTSNDYAVIHKSLTANLQRFYGEVDRSLPKSLLQYLRRYVKMAMLSKSYVFDSSKFAGRPDLNLAFCLYVLPDESLDPKVQEYLQAVKKLGLDNNQEIKKLRAQPITFSRLEKMAKIVKREKERFNLKGFWEVSMQGLMGVMGDQLLSTAYDKLQEINRQFDYSPMAIATKVIFFLEILHYINQKRHDPDFLLLMELSQVDERNLNGFSKQVLSLLRDALIQLQAMPDQSHDSMVSACGILIFRASCLLRQAVYPNEKITLSKKPIPSK